MELYQQIFFTTIAVAFAMLHLVLYLNNRHLKSNLYFAIFALLYAGNIFFDFQSALSVADSDALFYLRIHRAVMPYNPIFALLFIYSLFELRIPKHFWVIAAGLAITGTFAIYEPVKNFSYLQIFMIAMLIEASRLIVAGLRDQREGARIIATGFALIAVFSIYDMLLDFGVIKAINDIQNGYPFGFFGLILFMSIYLARDFAQTNRRLLEKERQAQESELERHLLEIEDQRKSKELAEARELQLAMLPKPIAELDGFDICFSMRPATEVGGDYYDYHVAADGTLTVAIGDATGHGMKAGLMVSIIKSLFMTLVDQSDIAAFFKQVSQTIKRMKLGNLYMAMMIAKFADGRLTASSAGMPPLIVFRKATGVVEDFVMKGMPLGAFEALVYETVETELASGDVVLLMSDGLPESFNKRKEMLDYDRINAAFLSVADKTPDQIVDHLNHVENKWRGSHSQEDDITLLVLKVK